MISNISSNYTICTTMNTIQNITSLVYYPLILLILIILPIIVLIKVLSLKLSNRTRIFILYFNIIYSLLLPIIGAAIMTDFELKSYIYGIILNNPFIISTFYHINIALAEIYQIIALFMYAYFIINTLIIMIIGLSGKIKFSDIWTYVNMILDHFKLSNFKSLINHVISGIKSCTTSNRNNENKK